MGGNFFFEQGRAFRFVLYFLFFMLRAPLSSSPRDGEFI